MTNAEFAQQCAYFASRMAGWSGDSLTLPEERDERVRDWVMANFLKDFRERLDRIEQRWMEPAKPPATTPGGEEVGR